MGNISERGVGMKLCEFLSLSGEDVECFTDCPFYRWDENDGICPFEEEERLKVFEMNDNIEYLKNKYPGAF